MTAPYQGKLNTQSQSFSNKQPRSRLLHPLGTARICDEKLFTINIYKKFVTIRMLVGSWNKIMCDYNIKMVLP